MKFKASVLIAAMCAVTWAAPAPKVSGKRRISLRGRLSNGVQADALAAPHGSIEDYVIPIDKAKRDAAVEDYVIPIDKAKRDAAVEDYVIPIDKVKRDASVEDYVIPIDKTKRH